MAVGVSRVYLIHAEALRHNPGDAALGADAPSSPWSWADTATPCPT